VFTATFNERENITRLCEEILRLPLMPDLLVVDDSSPDGTGELLDGIAVRQERLRVIHRPYKLGLGSAHKLAMHYATTAGYDVLVTMDADFSHNPIDIPRLVAVLDGADFVVGSRFMEGGTCDYQGYRKFVSVAANTSARLLLGVPLHEFTTSFRAFRVAMLREVGYPAIRSQGYSFFMESVWHIARAGYRCIEVPISFIDRQQGESKIPRHEIVNGALKLLDLWWRRAHRWRRPTVPTQPAAGRCALCGSDMRIEIFSARRAGDAGAAAAYRCTSMAHHSKPQVVQCLVCGLVAAGSSDPTEQVVARYAEVQDPTYLANRVARKRTFTRVFQAIRAYLPRSGRLLEVGAYCGIFLEVAAEEGWTVEGVEPSRWAVAVARARGLSVHSGTLQQADAVLTPPYDAVVMWDVLEHLSDPVAELTRVNRQLVNDGWLCLSTLDMNGWLPRLLGRHWPWIMDMHLYYFTVDILRQLLHRTGFELVAVRPYWHYSQVGYLVEKAAAVLPRPLGRFAAALGSLVPNSLLVPVYFGDVKLFVCRKVATLATADMVAVPSGRHSPASAG
jgi:GT2 family glycosyltransferase/predicted TPR repeat methyltransferase